ncbi:DedA family protein [Falsibacillus pallidus]|uniref:Membrane protein DedA with SNARE-associated domain n=1 Tax=Falsibacillus pallidus TaxID=493781 RepID=A0A370GD39_9BACI|nr:DedA family protein [Falsibacillus pallidus]RDI39883.1 membrane protein DedA with SNARE-associated domain [Falsibacillus pallidus]
MNEHILELLNQYSYLLIFVMGFFGIVGIPAPEESLFVYLGVLSKQGGLSLIGCIASSTLGSFTGMVTAYLLGAYIGKPFLSRFGKYLGLNSDRWESFMSHWNVKRSLLKGFFIPGVRQLNPYFAGIEHISFLLFLLLSFVGALIWTSAYTLLGFFISTYIPIHPIIITYVGIALFALFIIQMIIRWIKSRQKKRANG